MTNEEFAEKLREGWEIVDFKVDGDVEKNEMWIDFWIQPPPTYTYHFKIKTVETPA